MKSFEQALELVQEKVLGWAQDLVLMLPNLVVAIAVVLAFVMLAALSRRLVRRGLKHVSERAALNQLVANLTGFTVVCVGLLVALNVLSLDKTVMSLLAGVGVVGLALGFAFQDIASNFMAGLLILLRRPLKVGDIVRIGDHFGTAENIDLRNTTVRTWSGESVLIPNRDVFQTPMVNFSRTRERAVELTVGVSYGDDLEKVRKITMEAVSETPHRDPERPVEFFYSDFGDSSINFLTRIWLTSPEQPIYAEARSEAIISLKRAFDENDITIPFPIRTLDFGIKGGLPLSEIAPLGQKRGDGDQPWAAA